jgi:hypothetical protein
MVTSDVLLERNPDELERDLIACGRRDRAPDAARRRALASMTIAAATGAGLATTSVSSGASAASSVVPWLVATKWLAVGVAAGAVTLGVAGSVQRRATEVRREASGPIAAPAVPATSPMGLASPPASAVDVPSPADVRPHAETAEPSGVAPSRPRMKRAPDPTDEPLNLHEEASPPLAPVPPASTGTIEESSLVREVRLLEEARGALDAHAPARALAALDRYAHDFPTGRMGIEASALRIETLHLTGQRDAARTLAQAFLTKHPRSPAAMRVTRLLEAIDSGSVP